LPFPMARRKTQTPLRADAGMTILELLVVVAVLGILFAIAIQQYQLHRARAVDASMRSDLKNAAMAMESYYGEFLEYPSSSAAILVVGYRNTSGVLLTINVTSPSSFTLTAARDHGSQPSFTYDSSTGLIN